MDHVLIEPVVQPAGAVSRSPQFNAVATDGRRLVVLRMDADPDDVAGFIPAAAWAAASKVKVPKREDFRPRMVANGDITVHQSPTTKQKFQRCDIDGSFPRYKSAIPDWAHDAWQGPNERMKVCFNPQYLLEIANALGTDEEGFGVSLEFEPARKLIEEIVRDEKGNPVIVTDDKGNASVTKRTRAVWICERPIVVRASNRPDNLGVLMPITID